MSCTIFSLILLELFCKICIGIWSQLILYYFVIVFRSFCNLYHVFVWVCCVLFERILRLASFSEADGVIDKLKKVWWCDHMNFRYHVDWRILRLSSFHIFIRSTPFSLNVCYCHVVFQREISFPYYDRISSVSILLGNEWERKQRILSELCCFYHLSPGRMRTHDNKGWSVESTE